MVAPGKGIWISKSVGSLCLWNPQPWVLESGIQLKESGILLTIKIRIQVPLAKKPGIHCLVSGI